MQKSLCDLWWNTPLGRCLETVFIYNYYTFHGFSETETSFPEHHLTLWILNHGPGILFYGPQLPMLVLTKTVTRKYNYENQPSRPCASPRTSTPTVRLHTHSGNSMFPSICLRSLILHAIRKKNIRDFANCLVFWELWFVTGPVQMFKCGDPNLLPVKFKLWDNTENRWRNKQIIRDLKQYDPHPIPTAVVGHNNINFYLGK